MITDRPGCPLVRRLAVGFIAWLGVRIASRDDVEQRSLMLSRLLQTKSVEPCSPLQRDE